MSPAAPPRWRVWVDTGGTFTDCVAVDPAGDWHRAKVLSSSSLRGIVAERRADGRLRLATTWALPDGFFDGCRFRLLDGAGGEAPVTRFVADGPTVELAGELEGAEPGRGFELLSAEEAPVLAARLVTSTPVGRELPPIAMRLATTRGTNALLERGGAPTALFITAGFADLLEIGTQQRPELFALAVRKPEPLYAAVVEVAERLAADGSVLRPLVTAALAPTVQRLLAAGVTSAAVALLHSYRNDTHERALAAFLRAAGMAHVSTSSELAPLIKLLPRAETAVVDAYLAPVVGDYLERVRGALAGGSSLHVMTSAGGLMAAAQFRAKDSLLSGPAGGVVGAARAGRRSGVERLVAFDMGGTSTDVARFDGDFEYQFETRVEGVRLMAPSLAIETVAAGGGSVCSFAGTQVKVGPRSAGARPGPACYGAGGPLTITDVNLLLGRLAADRFEIPIVPEAAARQAEDLRREVAAARAGEVALEALLEGLLEIANERMADAIRRISVRRGYDPADYTLVAFGGAGPQHACALAALLGMPRVLVPADAGLLSALGLGRARIERFAARQVLRPLAESAGQIDGWLDELARRACAAVAAEGVAASDVGVRRRLAYLRFTGQDAALAVEAGADGALAERFARAYEQLYGYRPAAREVEVESLRVVASSRGEVVSPAPLPPPVRARAAGARRAWLGGRWRKVSWYDRPALAPGARLDGPALIFERHSATVVEAGWTARVDGAGALCLERRGEER